MMIICKVILAIIVEIVYLPKTLILIIGGLIIGKNFDEKMAMINAMYNKGAAIYYYITDNNEKVEYHKERMSYYQNVLFKD